MDAVRLASALAGGVAGRLPHGFTALAVGTEILLEGPVGGYGGGHLVLNVAGNMIGREERDAVRHLAARFLSDLQDFVAEATAEPWPAAGQTEMPANEAAVVGDFLTLVFLDREGHPVLELPPIRLDAIQAEDL